MFRDWKCRKRGVNWTEELNDMEDDVKLSKSSFNIDFEGTEHQNLALTDKNPCF